MEAARHPPPTRKACDLCYRRKIKCDGAQPQCSTCVVYKCDCTYKAASRKAPSCKQAAAQRQRRQVDLESRVDHLESQLAAVLGKLDRWESRHGRNDAPATTGSTSSSLFSTTSESSPNAQLRDETSGLRDLPPLHIVLPLVEYYLANLNTVLPLFHPTTLLQTVNSWYSHGHPRSRVNWALINVVLALAHHTGVPGEFTPVDNAATFLTDAQSVVTEIIMRDGDLVSIQVLLGLVIIFWSDADPGPALILIGTALRLAHRHGLHARQSSAHLDPVLATQRSRVFWLAYILDRDISLYNRVAPMQLDADIDLDLPPIDADDDLAGVIFAADGTIKLNFFRARVELARIQGKVYEYVYSTSGQKASGHDRAQNSAAVMQMLDDWSSAIGPEFQPARVSEQAHMPQLSRFVCILHSASLTCRAVISFASASDSFHFSAWLQRLQDYGETATGAQVEVGHARMPRGSRRLIDAARDYLVLFNTIDSSRDSFFRRITLCAHNSSLVCLIAHRVFNPHNWACIQSDEDITKSAMKNLDEAAAATVSEKLQKIRDAMKRVCLYSGLFSTRTASCPKALPLDLSSLEDGSSGTSPPISLIQPLESDFLTNDDMIMPWNDLWLGYQI